MGWKSIFPFLWCLLGLEAIVNRAVGQEPTVILPQGKLNGIKMYTDSRVTINAFLGIPYASAPIGDLRFAAPQKHQGWNRTLFAGQFGPSCPQLPASSKPNKPPIVQDENCLFLNVWAPEGASSFRRTAVVVYLEGEGFVSGSSSYYPAQDLAAEGIVVVSVNYRLNVFGFFCLEDEEARGNLGLLDQYFALLWVRENIEAFGGDPRSVTVMGHSAGSASVLFHMASPRTAGLFRQAILMSGSITSPWYKMSSPGNSSRAMARSLGCLSATSNAILRCLRAKPVAEILRAFETQYKNGNWTELVLPTVDSFLPASEQYIPLDPEDVFKSGDYQQFPVLTGLTSREGVATLYQWGDVAKLSFSDLYYFFNTTAITNAIERYGYNTNKRSEIREIIKWQYMDKVKDGDTNHLLSQLIEFYSDAQYRAPQAKLLPILARSPEPLFVYKFDQSGGPDIYSNTINVSGSAHGAVLMHLFSPSLWQQTGRRMTPNEDRLSKNIKRIWADFIRQGEPLPGPYGYGINWKQYKPEEQNIFVIQNNLQRPRTNENLEADAETFWNEFLPRIEKANSLRGDPSQESRELQFGPVSDSSQPFRSAMYTLIGFISVLIVMLIVCLVLLKKRAKERDRDIF